ncbi:MAG: type I-E CRISPR-associated protein Cse2/CasB [Mesorhizobium sp.]
MSEEKARGPGAIALGWWRINIAARENPAARGLSARLRRGAPLAVLCEPAVHELARGLGLGSRDADVDRLVRLVSLLAELRESDAAPLARLLGGKEPILSRSRFEKLIRAEGDELTTLLRRAIVTADRRCNVTLLAQDLLHWNAGTRNRWCFHYFGADAPAGDGQKNDLRETTE